MHTCTHCRHTWFPRRPARPVVCPRCKSYSWDKPPRPVGRPRKVVTRE